MRPAWKRFRALATLRFRRRSWRRAGAAFVTLARATSQRRPPDRAIRKRTPDTDWVARAGRRRWRGRRRRWWWRWRRRRWWRRRLARRDYDHARHVVPDDRAVVVIGTAAREDVPERLALIERARVERACVRGDSVCVEILVRPADSRSGCDVTEGGVNANAMIEDTRVTRLTPALCPRVRAEADHDCSGDSAGASQGGERLHARHYGVVAAAVFGQGRNVRSDA